MPFLASAPEPPNSAALPPWPLSDLTRRWRGFFVLAAREASFAVRGFPRHHDGIRRHLEHIGETFLAGYNCALLEDDARSVQDFVAELDPDYRGFAVEGATMGAAVADAVSLGADRLRAWMVLNEPEYTYLTHAGAGWALARMPWRRKPIFRSTDPIHGWLVYDGLGFHDAYFKPIRISRGWRRIRRGYAANAYDQGIGRALWFVSGGDPLRAAAVISAFPEARRSDLWSGLGLALAYAGGADERILANVLLAAGPLRPCLAQGAAFAAEARLRARHLPVHAATAVSILTGRDPENIVRLVRQLRHQLPSAETAELPRYEIWRRVVQRALAETKRGSHV